MSKSTPHYMILEEMICQLNNHRVNHLHNLQTTTMGVVIVTVTVTPNKYDQYYSITQLLIIYRNVIILLEFIWAHDMMNKKQGHVHMKYYCCRLLIPVGFSTPGKCPNLLS